MPTTREIEQEIHNLISLPKAVIERLPASGYSEQSGCMQVILISKANNESNDSFRVFIRQSIKRRSNYSIGLDYITIAEDNSKVEIPITRYNSPHSENQTSGHNPKPHIHTVSPDDYQKAKENKYKIELRKKENTLKYSNFSEVIDVFPNDIFLYNFGQYFKIEDFQTQERLF